MQRKERKERRGRLSLLHTCRSRSSEHKLLVSPESPRAASTKPIVPRLEPKRSRGRSKTNASEVYENKADKASPGGHRHTNVNGRGSKTAARQVGDEDEKLREPQDEVMAGLPTAIRGRDSVQRDPKLRFLPEVQPHLLYRTMPGGIKPSMQVRQRS